MAKAIALLSGGLDSTLAARMVIEQGIEVEALTYAALFSSVISGDLCKPEARRSAEILGVPLRVMDHTKSFLEIVKHPKHGYGSNMNPCIDCRILMLRETIKYMRKVGADFIVSGEVVGQRPMSQKHHTIKMIDKQAGVEGYILRPLCAKRLRPTIAEENGIVDRERLLDISGRSRKPQIALARRFHITDYPSPGGGCLLTDPAFGRKMQDLLRFNIDADLNDVHLLKLGRHFRIDERTKVVIGRDEEENPKILSLARNGDRLLELAMVPGPLTLLRGDITDTNIQSAAALTVRYSKARNEKEVRVLVKSPGSVQTATLKASALDKVLTSQMDISVHDKAVRGSSE